MLGSTLTRGGGFVSLQWWHRADAQPPSQFWTRFVPRFEFEAGTKRIVARAMPPLYGN